MSLIDFEATNGINGIAIRDGAHVTLTGVNSHDNTRAGILIQTASSAALTNVTATNNVIGVSIDDGVSVAIDSSTFTGNVVRDLQLTFGSRVSIQSLVVGTYACDATVLVRGGSITCPH